MAVPFARLAVFLGFSMLVPFAMSHTWIEQMQVISPNGSYTGDYGYPRGYVARTDPGFTGFSDKWQLPSPDTDIGATRINSNMFACHPSQREANYSPQYPKLSVAPGDFVAMKYLENGHVSQPGIPAGKPKSGGTVYIFGTYKPSSSEKLTDVLAWTKDGKGGNGKGWLMASQNYDDGRCYQINSSPISIERQAKNGNQELWCESNLEIPANAPAGSTLTTYWVWDWATEGEGAKDEYYTTCSDFDVAGGNANNKLATTSKHPLVQQNNEQNAVSDYKSRKAIVSNPRGQSGSASAPGSIAAPAPAPSSSMASSVTNSPPAVTSAPAATAPASEAVVTATRNVTVTAPGVVVYKTVTVPASGSAPTGQAPAPHRRAHVRDFRS
ncbi:hypothetical protein WHR41_00122 [Cladosporium halotolerans]|uniref:DUF7492 domain-containing protein n=1 Tax=Cladosporium halotolerans TaxID=1052096 RepID=A0AB34L4V4_9PEZI